MKVYMAGPIHHADDHGKGWRELVKDNYSSIEWVDPFDKYDTTDDHGYEWTAEDIVEDDLVLIDESDAVLVHWELVSTCGTPMEVRYAYQNDIPVVVQTTVEDEDISPWLEYHVDGISRTFRGAVELLTDDDEP